MNMFWYKCDTLLEMSDEELDLWKSRGVGGFTCQTRHLRHLGGTQHYTGEPNHPLDGEEYERQRRIRSSRIIERLHARGMKAYFGFWVANYHVPVTPFGDWFDDAAWEGIVLPELRAVAAMAKLEGFDGLAIDQEDYPGNEGRRLSWDANYASGTRSEAAVRERVRQRGSEVMRALVTGYPDVALNVYHWNFPGSWQELVQHEVNQAPPDNAAGTVFLEFWDGMTSVEGYRQVRFLDAIFYKTTHLRASWDDALRYNANRLYATFSRGFRNWDHAAPRVAVSPFSWIDHNEQEYPYRSQTKEEVDAQLAAFRVWGMEGEFHNFAYHAPLSSYDYSPYLPALRAAAEPGQVDDQAPSLRVATPEAAGPGAVILRGVAGDNLAVRSVRWRTGAGAAGQATMTWVAKGGDARQGYDWEMEWRAEGVPVVGGTTTVTVTVEDIKGLETTVEVPVG